MTICRLLNIQSYKGVKPVVLEQKRRHGMALELEYIGVVRHICRKCLLYLHMDRPCAAAYVENVGGTQRDILRKIDVVLEFIK